MLQVYISTVFYSKFFNLYKMYFDIKRIYIFLYDATGGLGRKAISVDWARVYLELHIKQIVK